MTASRPVRPLRRRARSPAPRAPARWRWRFRSAQPKPSRPSPSTPTRWVPGRPKFFFAVGQGYRNFRQTSDDEVIALLDRARGGFRDVLAGGSAADPPLRDEEVEVVAGPVSVAGHLTIPKRSTGIVVFAHGSGSSRHSPRNRYVADVLNAAGLATVLFDLLTAAEERNRANVFDIELLAHRLVDVTSWLTGQPDTASLPVGYSVPVRERARPWSRPPIPERTSQRWSPAAGGPTSPVGR